MLPCSLGTYCISSSATRRAGGYKPLAKPLINFNQNYKRLNLFWVGPESKRGWAIFKFAIRKSSSITNHAVVHLLQWTIVSNSFYCVEYIHHTLAILPTSHNFWLVLRINFEQIASGRGWLQNFSTRFIKSCGLAVRTSNITKLRTCGCGFKNSEMSLRTCGCGLSF